MFLSWMPFNINIFFQYVKRKTGLRFITLCPIHVVTFTWIGHQSRQLLKNPPNSKNQTVYTVLYLYPISFMLSQKSINISRCTSKENYNIVRSNYKIVIQFEMCKFTILLGKHAGLHLIALVFTPNCAYQAKAGSSRVAAKMKWE